MSVNLSGLDLSNVAARAALDAMPAGWYNAKIVDSEMKPTKDGNGQYLALTLEVLDGPYVGRKIFDRLNLQNANPTAVQIAYETLKSIYNALHVVRVNDSSELHGKPLMVKVKKRAAEGDYEASNDVSGYDAAGSAHSLVTSAPVVPGVAGAPGAVPAWAAGAAAGAATAQPAAAQPAAAAGAPPWAAGAAQPWAQPGAAAAATSAPPPAAAAAPPPVAAAPRMTAKATFTYEQYKESGWSDQQLIENGLMEASAPPPAPVPAAPPAPVAAPPGPPPATAGGPTPPWAR